MEESPDRIKRLSPKELLKRQIDFLIKEGIEYPLLPTNVFESLAIIAPMVTKALMYPTYTEHWYFITLTSIGPDPSDVLRCFDWLKDKYTISTACIELTKKGLPHIHLILSSKSYVNKQHVYRKNNNNYVDFRKIKGQKDHIRIEKYITKAETKPDDAWLVKYNLSSTTLVG